MLKIKKFQPKYIKEWNNFVDFSNNGTLFHSQTFISYHIERKFIDCSLMVYYNNKLVALFPASIKNKNSIFSHPGASFGGFVLKNKLGFSMLNDIICLVNNYFKSKKFKSIFVVNTPKIYYKRPHDSIDYLLQWNGYNQKELYISHAVDLNINKVDVLLNKRKQRYINNLKHDVKFITSFNFKAFYSLLIESKKRYHSVPTHSLSELIKLNTLFPDKIKLFISKDGDELVGGSLLFFINKKTYLIFYNVVSENYRKTQLSTFQFFNCIKFAKKEGASVIDFGVSHLPEMDNPLAPKFSLIKFKEQFGAFGVIRTGYEKEL